MYKIYKKYMKITIKDLYDFNLKYKKLNNIKIQTKYGLKDIECVDITAKNSIKIIVKTTSFELKTSPNHLLYKNGWIKVKKLKIGDFIDTINGYEKIISLDYDNKKEDLYDIQVENKEFYANNIRSHNSTIKQVIELCIFGKVQGKTGKRLSLKELPNRRNHALFSSINFNNHFGQEITMSRKIKPDEFKMTVDNENYTERFKRMGPKEREKLIGYSYEIFKSFISLNINDFKNFISLNKEDKENLLNKLFNLNNLDTLLSITKDLDKTNQKSINEYDNLIYDNDIKISDFKQTIQNIKDKEQFSKKEKLKKLKQTIFDKKPIYLKLENDIKEFNVDISKINKKFIKLNILKSDKEKERNKFEFENDVLEEKIKTYESGICPTCETILTNENHINHLKEFKLKIIDNNTNIEQCNNFLNRCILEYTKLKNNNSEIFNNKSKLIEEFNLLKIELGTLNQQYKELSDEKDDDISTENLEERIINLKEKNKEYNELLLDLNHKSNTYEELKNIFNFDGIRKSLISNAIKPINKHLNDYLNKLNSEYKAVLNDNFDATIYELETLEINPETLSKGEDRKINIAIALSYLKIILELKHSNIIFLDEVFDGVDVKNIELILNLLKELSEEYKINIIIVTHGLAELKNFEKLKKNFSYIIETKKDIFSNLIIKKL